jgi:protein-S-isoprenylcysteine O-methyltransferase Ste14
LSYSSDLISTEDVVYTLLALAVPYLVVLIIMIWNVFKMSNKFNVNVGIIIDAAVIIITCFVQILICNYFGLTYWYSGGPSYPFLLPFYIGGIIHIVSLIQLGGNWVNNQGPLANGRLVSTGIYRIVRHPVYLAFILEGIVLMQLSHWLFLVGLYMICLPVHRLVFNNEERALILRYGKLYQEYCLRTPWKLIPFIY